MEEKSLVKLDRIDRSILAQLQENGDLSNTDLADRVGLSPSPCLRRVRLLEEAGIIVRKVTVLNARKLGLTLTAMVQIGMDRHTPDRFETFEKTVAGYPEVQACYLITGQDADYLLQVIVPDMDAYQSLLLERITRIPGVTGVHSSFVMRKVVDRPALPLNYV
ncbi:Lrp/AsnC family leucine-responsive transcriptional regulator [Litorivivens lipolytica]|uniref:Lrp/AsnC family leucine-responsive transcriptional regulator n=1 Tax=Litorivivens lipolytica TaxID=1524264 RepID=A0A7W4W6I1_9GAMM|nr:Lrp/AsnC family transcriptional regulator [Litorivivens lipolytica]MBB3047804.1 Lrp/AsnC family leucine-responsive transcriptional regulator [Litorivivens lipolytica]